MTVFQSSRYNGVPQAAIEAADGTTRKFIVPTPLNIAPISGYTKHTVRDGDRLDWLATKYLHSPSMWWVIAAVNPGVFMPEGLQPGSVLLIPVL